MPKKNTSAVGQILSALPSVDEVLRSPAAGTWLDLYPRRFVTEGIRKVIAEWRNEILRGGKSSVPRDELDREMGKAILSLSSYHLQPVINATGIVIHTNLGRSVLSETVMRHIAETACGYSNLEYDLERGMRGKRYVHVQRILRDITGAEEGFVVNNNAAAVFLCLNELAAGREVIVSRGELVEIGGSFRIPDVMSRSGAALIEVGTTNKTHLRDYENAVTDRTALILKVHQSNFRIVGFTSCPSLEELVSLGRKLSIPVLFDLGSGCIVDLGIPGFAGEPTVRDVIRAGADLVTFSGDKLLGGPQGGIIAGRAELIEKIAGNPLTRALRVDKLTLAALEATLMIYADPGRARATIPTLALLLQEPDVILKRARRIARILRIRIREAGGNPSIVRVTADNSQAGGGSLPEVFFPTFVVSLKPADCPVSGIEKGLRSGMPPVIARIRDDTLLFDARTIRDGEIPALVTSLMGAMCRASDGEKPSAVP